jgi:hypothetical protein
MKKIMSTLGVVVLVTWLAGTTNAATINFSGNVLYISTTLQILPTPSTMTGSIYIDLDNMVQNNSNPNDGERTDWNGGDDSISFLINFGSTMLTEADLNISQSHHIEQMNEYGYPVYDAINIETNGFYPLDGSWGFTLQEVDSAVEFITNTSSLLNPYGTLNAMDYARFEIRSNSLNLVVNVDSFEIISTPVPEPSTYLMVATGLAGLICGSRRRGCRCGTADRANDRRYSGNQGGSMQRVCKKKRSTQ